MKKRYYLLAAIVIAVVIGKLTSPSDTVEKSKLWYQGGTLHKATVAEWNTATSENKLATCADFMAKYDNTVGIDILRDRAGELLICLDEALKALPADSSDEVAQYAAGCTLIMYDK